MSNEIISVAEYHSNLLDVAMPFDLVLLDIDDVILTTEVFVCGSQWYHRYYDKYKDILHPEQILKDVYDCMDEVTFKVVSPELVNDFSFLSENKKVFALTARRFDFADKTDIQLQEIGMSFSEENLDHEIIRNGVIYSGNIPNSAVAADKGVVLNNLIDLGVFGLTESVILIDDNLKNLHNMQKACANNGINFLGIYYTKVSDDFLETYTEEELEIIGHNQFLYFRENGVFLTNHQALYLTEDL